MKKIRVYNREQQLKQNHCGKTWNAAEKYRYIAKKLKTVLTSKYTCQVYFSNILPKKKSICSKSMIFLLRGFESVMMCNIYYLFVVSLALNLRCIKSNFELEQQCEYHASIFIQVNWLIWT